MSTLQTGLTIADGAVTGTLKHVTSGSLPDVWGAGNFMALAFTPAQADEGVAKYKVGLTPSEDSGLVELDSDMDGAFKVTDKDTQKLTVVTVGEDGHQTRQYYDLSGLTCETS